MRKVRTVEQVKVGIIGCGKFSKAQHLPNCRDSESVQLWHCCDIAEGGRQLALEYGSEKITSDYRQVLADPEVEMVILAVPHNLHLQFIEESLQAGKHVFCEKPMTMTMEESYRVLRAVKKSGTKLCVDFMRRFSPAMVDMKKAFAAHLRGPRKSPRVYTQEGNREKWAEESQSSILIRVQDESLTYTGTHVDRMQGGGSILGDSCHLFDLICWLLEERPVRVSGMGSVRLDHIVNIEFESGSLASIFFGTHGSFEYPKELIEIQSHAKIFRSECFVENQYFGCGDRTVKHFRLQNDFQPDHGKQGGLAGYLEKIDAMGNQFEATGQFDYVFPDKGHKALLQSFVDATQNDLPSPIDEYAGMRATYLCLLAMESIRTGLPMPVRLEDWEMYVH